MEDLQNARYRALTIQELRSTVESALNELQMRSQQGNESAETSPYDTSFLSDYFPWNREKRD